MKIQSLPFDEIMELVAKVDNMTALFMDDRVPLSLFMKATGLRLEVTYRHPFDDFILRFENAEVKRGLFMRSVYSVGLSTAMEALHDYVEKIRGKTLVIDVMLDSRREILVPQTLYVDKFKLSEY